MRQLIDWYLEPLRKFGQLSGRARRGEFWTFALVNALVGASVSSIEQGLGAYSEQLGFGPVSGLLALVLFIPGIAVTVRRLHDSDLSGWWYLIILIPLVGPVVQLIQLVRKGTRGSNDYGPDPLGEVVVDQPSDGGPPYATQRGRFSICPWCRQSNPPGRDSCQWCHNPYREAGGPV